MVDGPLPGHLQRHDGPRLHHVLGRTLLADADQGLAVHRQQLVAGLQPSVLQEGLSLGMPKGTTVVFHSYYLLIS